MAFNVLFVKLPNMPFIELEKCLKGENNILEPIEMPLGILYLSSYCKMINPDINIALLDFALNVKHMQSYNGISHFIQEVAKTETSIKPDIIAFSLTFSTSYKFFIEANKALGSVWPSAITVVGGNHATNSAKEIFENSDVMYLFKGEGEIAFAEFVKRASLNRNLNDIPGVYSRSSFDINNSMTFCQMLENLDELPFPDWDILEIDSYVSTISGRKTLHGSVEKKVASIMTNRGCPFSCIFCSSHTVHGRKMRYRSPQNVVDELKELNQKYGVNLILPMDDLFVANKAVTLSLLNAIHQANIPGLELQFPNGINLNTVDFEVIDAMEKAGMRVVFLAIESGSEYVQKHIIKKRAKLKKAKEIVRYLQDKNIMVRCFFILGFPGETLAQMQETIEFAKDLQPDWCVMHVAAPLKGSEMYDMIVNMGYLEDDPKIWDGRLFYERKYDTPEISAVELNKLCDRSSFELNYANNRSLMNGEYEKVINIFTDIINKHPYNIFARYCRAVSYHNQGMPDKVLLELNEIRRRIEKDNRSSAMNEEYIDLIKPFADKLGSVEKG